ncbi:MAG: homoserine dehydrogenase [Acidimicrobiales bacterium]
MNGSPVRVGLLGCGTVGSALIQLVQEQADGIEARTGMRLEIVRVAVRNASKDRGVDLARDRFTNDAASVVTDPEVDVVIEVIGGIEPARQLILDALKAGKPVITANKELLANHGGEIFATAETSGDDVMYEAAVGGGIPLVRPLRESLLGEPIDQVMGIVNGTTNYILTRMTEAGVDYAEALAEAQELGYAEADPTADVEGYDAGAKIAILASIAFGARVVAGDVYHEGISGITADDMSFATRNGYVVKLVAIAEKLDANRADASSGVELAVRVHPVMLRSTHPLASVRGSFNAVFVQGAAVGELMFYGRGAGGNPTASAVLGDLIDAALNLRKGSSASVGALGEVPIRPIDELVSEYYVHLDVVDQPGVLSAVAGVFGAHGVSISSMEQEGLGHEADLVFITHRALERDVQATLRDLRELDVVHHVGSVIRVLDDEPDLTP